MNKAKKAGGKSLRRYSQETERYLGDAVEIVKHSIKENKLKAKVFETTIPERVGIKRAVQEGMPTDLKQPFQNLWKEIEGFINE